MIIMQVIYKKKIIEKHSDNLELRSKKASANHHLLLSHWKYEKFFFFFTRVSNPLLTTTIIYTLFCIEVHKLYSHSDYYHHQSVYYRYSL